MHLLFKCKMRECTELGLNCKDERGYGTIACVVALLYFVTKKKFFTNSNP